MKNNNEVMNIFKAEELLITIDMVNGFVKEGSLAAPSIERVVPRQVEILDEAIADDKTGLIFIRDCHTKNSVELKRYAPHCLKDTRETELIDAIKKYEIYGLTFFKNSTNLTYVLADTLTMFNNLKEIKLMGCLSDVCVFDGAIGLRTYLDEINKDVTVSVYEDAIDTYDSPTHPADLINHQYLDLMENKGIKILRRTK